MAKVCNSEGCNNPVFSKGYCKYHQNQRTDDKWITSLAKRNNPKVNSIKKKVLPTPKIYSGINDLNAKGEAELFKKIWDSRGHVSFLSSKLITEREGSPFWFSIFAHVLAKGKAKYPKFKMYSKNIIILTPTEHFLLDHCSEDERQKYASRNNCNWDKVYELRCQLKREYALFD